MTTLGASCQTVGQHLVTKKTVTKVCIAMRHHCTSTNCSVQLTSNKLGPRRDTTDASPKKAVQQIAAASRTRMQSS